MLLKSDTYRLHFTSRLSITTNSHQCHMISNSQGKVRSVQQIIKNDLWTSTLLIANMVFKLSQEYTNENIF